MRISAEKLIAPPVLIAATSAGTGLELPFGTFGISIEHTLLLFYLCVLIFRKYGRSGLEFGFAALLACISGILGAAIIQIANAHLVSLVVLSLMFPLFIRYFEYDINPQRVVAIALALIVVQCIFFPYRLESYETGWDYLWLPGIGFVNRLAILGFVSNSLALMLLPIYIYFLHQLQTKSEEKVLNFLLCLVVVGLIGATFSRTAIILVVVVTPLLLSIKALLKLMVVGLVLAITDPYQIFSLMLLSVGREGDISESIRVIVWLQAISDWQVSDLLLGAGIQNPPLDNTYLSIVIGTGFLGILALIAFLFALARWLLFISKVLPRAEFRAVIIVVGALLISANTYDIFSQRKILFGAALVIGALLANEKTLYLRR